MFNLNKALNDCYYSDLYKSVYGSRPLNVFFASQAELDSEVEFLSSCLSKKLDEEKIAQSKNIEDFNIILREIQNLVKGSTEKDAFRLFLQANNLEEDYKFYGLSFIECEFNLPYGSLYEKFKRNVA